MFLKERTEAVILNHQPIGEADSQFILFTNQLGKIQAVARGERKILSKMRGGLGLFSWSEVELIRGYRQPIITSARPKMLFPNLSRDWSKFVVAQRMSREIEALTPWNLPDENTWFIYLGALDALNLIKSHHQRLYYYFLWTLINSWGYQINLHHCARCGNKLQSETFFLTVQDGIICANCRKVDDQSEEISANTIKILRLIAAKDKNRLGRIITSSADRKNLEKASRFFINSIRTDQALSSVN